MNRARCAILYTPRDSLQKITKVSTLGFDYICMDMEDDVPFNWETAARQTIFNALISLNYLYGLWQFERPGTAHVGGIGKSL